MERARKPDEAVLFIDEFEEIAGNRDSASRLDKSITDELLAQLPLLKEHAKKLLLVFATNYVRDPDAALLGPGRFDCIIPVRGRDDAGRRTIFGHYLSRTNNPEVDAGRIVLLNPLLIPADSEYLDLECLRAYKVIAGRHS